MLKNNNSTEKGKKMSSTQKTFSKRIKQLKEEKDKIAKKDGKAYGYPEMTRKFGKQEAAIRAWETGRTMPGAETLVEISHEFDCSIDYLLGVSTHRVDKSVYDESQQKLLSQLASFGEMEPYLIGALCSTFQNMRNASDDTLKTWLFALLLSLGDVSNIFSYLHGGAEYWTPDNLKATRAFQNVHFSDHGPDMSDGRFYAYALGKVAEYKGKSALFLKGYCLELFNMLKEDGLKNVDSSMEENDLIEIASLGRKEELPGGAYEMAKERVDNPYIRLTD